MWKRLSFACLLCSTSASAAKISWEPGPSAAACASAAGFERDLQIRLGKPLASVANAPQIIRIVIEKLDRRFVAKIELLDEGGKLAGERTISVQGERCQAIEAYLSLAVALMIDPDAALGAESVPEVASPAPEPAAEPASEPEPGPTEASTVPAPPPPTADATSAQVLGRGKTVVYLYPAFLPAASSKDRVRASRVHAATVSRDLLGKRLLEREIYTIVEPPPWFADEAHAEDWLQNSASQRRPQASDASGAAAPRPDIVLLPKVDSLIAQKGVDLRRGEDRALVTATATLSLTGMDYQSGEPIDRVSASATVSVDGKLEERATTRFATRLALLKAAEELLPALRAHGSFRVRPRVLADGSVALTSLRGVENGDYFQFEATDGTRSGYATVYGVEGDRAKLQVWKSGQGERVVDVGKNRERAFTFAFRHGVALGGDPSDADRTRATLAQKHVWSPGGYTSWGFESRYIFEPAGGSKLRPTVVSRFDFIGSHSLALDVSLGGGVGYEIAALPLVGLSVLPFVEGSATWIRGELGGNEQNSLPLDGVLGVAGTVGTKLEFYRLLGNVSLTATIAASYLVPLASSTARSAYVDGYPHLKTLDFALGALYRPSDYPETH